MNKAMLIGRLTADPVVRSTAGEKPTSFCRFTLAVENHLKKTEPKADFISCQAWRQTAEFVSKYFNKGSMICLEGSLRTGSYQDKNHSDVTHYTTDVLVDNVEFCGSKSEQGHSAPAPTQQTTPTAEAHTAEAIDLSEFEDILSDGDVPF